MLKAKEDTKVDFSFLVNFNTLYYNFILFKSHLSHELRTSMNGGKLDNSLKLIKNFFSFWNDWIINGI